MELKIRRTDARLAGFRRAVTRRQTMTELETRCLDAFPQWIRSLAEDVTALAQLLSSDSLPVDARRFIAGGLNYVFKSLDLIPDGLEGLGYLDDALVVRSAAHLAASAPGAKDAD